MMADLASMQPLPVDLGWISPAAAAVWIATRDAGRVLHVTPDPTVRGLWDDRDEQRQANASVLSAMSAISGPVDSGEPESPLPRRDGLRPNRVRCRLARERREIARCRSRGYRPGGEAEYPELDAHRARDPASGWRWFDVVIAFADVVNDFPAKSVLIRTVEDEEVIAAIQEPQRADGCPPGHDKAWSYLQRRFTGAVKRDRVRLLHRTIYPVGSVRPGRRARGRNPTRNHARKILTAYFPMMLSSLRANPATERNYEARRTEIRSNDG